MDTNYDVYKLIENGFLPKIQYLVENDLLDVNALIKTRYYDDMFDFYGILGIQKMHLLSAAAVCNQYEICDYLLSKGADPNLIMVHPGIGVLGGQGFSALFWSCGSNVSSKIMKLLLNHGANQFIENNIFKYAMVLLLHYMRDPISEDCLIKINLLAENFQSNTGDEQSQATILINVIEILHQNDQQPLCTTIIKKLIAKGIHADVYAISDNYTECVSHSGHRSPLEVAIECLCYPCVKVILNKSSAMVNRKDYGKAPLHVLSTDLVGKRQQFDAPSFDCEQAEIDILQLLLQHGANINEINASGATPLLISSCPKRKSKDPESEDSNRFKKLLLAMGADANIPDDSYRTPLMVSIERHFNLEDIELLLDSTDLSKSYLGLNLLMYCIFMENADSVRLLLNRGFDPNFVDSNQMSALHLACAKSKIEIIRLLLEQGANANRENACEETPMFFAHGSNFSEIQSLLIQYGANKGHRNIFGLTSEAIAVCELPVMYKYSIASIQSNRLCLEDGEIDDWLSREGWLLSLIERTQLFLGRPIILSSEHCRLVFKSVKVLLSRIADEVRKNYPKLSFTPVLSGSVSEGTKVTYPDEFDYLLFLDHFGDGLIAVKENCSPGYFKVRSQDRADDNLKPFFDEDRYLLHGKLKKGMVRAINYAIAKNTTFENLGLYLRNCVNTGYNQIPSIKLYWVNSSQKFMPISIDLAIAINIKQPPFCFDRIIKNPIIEEAKNESCFLILKASFEYIEEDKTKINGTVRASFSKIETKILKGCPPQYRMGYRLAKAIREWCPLIQSNYDKIKPEDVLSSYYLKTCLFHVLNNDPDMDLSPVKAAREIWNLLLKKINIKVDSDFDYVPAISSFFIDDYKIYDDPSDHKLNVKICHMISTMLSKISLHF
ncbi:uncharacterized protein [Clytia hemisphaerica]|uniref:Mab-21-like nucleotidyltransferase domain-containing protein n=1 Tax=Clytia hemisphaerica TaxID=252671 RepID=A0A7M5V0B4_9CNID